VRTKTSVARISLTADHIGYSDSKLLKRNRIYKAVCETNTSSLLFEKVEYTEQ